VCARRATLPHKSVPHIGQWFAVRSAHNRAVCPAGRSFFRGTRWTSSKVKPRGHAVQVDATRKERHARRAARRSSIYHPKDSVLRGSRTEGLELLEHNADTILQEIGIDFRDDPEALELLKGAGADVQGERVRFPRGLCRTIVQPLRAARVYSTRAQSRPHRRHRRNRTVFAPPTALPSAQPGRGRRYAKIEDFRNFVKLAYTRPPCTIPRHHLRPVDLPVNKRHFDMVYSHMKYSDKPYMGSVTHPERAQDTGDDQDPVWR